jgi:Mn2+/Fe2+ NRAMP family transporter
MRFGFRKIEAIVGTLIFTVLVIFVFEVFIASPHVTEVKYKLCGIIVAPIIPNAIKSAPLSVIIVELGTKPFNTSVT